MSVVQELPELFWFGRVRVGVRCSIWFISPCPLGKSETRIDSMTIKLLSVHVSLPFECRAYHGKTLSNTCLNHG